MAGGRVGKTHSENRQFGSFLCLQASVVAWWERKPSRRKTGFHTSWVIAMGAYMLFSPYCLSHFLVLSERKKGSATFPVTTWGINKTRYTHWSHARTENATIELRRPKELPEVL